MAHEQHERAVTARRVEEHRLGGVRGLARHRGRDVALDLALAAALRRDVDELERARGKGFGEGGHGASYSPRMARTRTIRSANADFQLALALRDNRRQRSQQGRFLVEGVRSIDAAVVNGWTIDSFWFAAGRPLSSWASGLLDSMHMPVGRPGRRGSGPDDGHVHGRGFPGAEKGHQSRPGGGLRMSTAPTIAVPQNGSPFPRSDDPLLVVLDRPASPGNLGSVIRSADALGADSVVVVGHAADVYDPQTVRASQGSLFAVPAVRVGSPEELELSLERVRIVGTSAHGDQELGTADLRGPIAVVLGNEAKGLSWAWRERVDALVRIPQRGSASSLNLAAAAAILLYEAERQRRGGAA